MIVVLVQLGAAMISFDAVYQMELIWRMSDPTFRQEMAGLLTADLFDAPLDTCFPIVTKRQNLMSLGQIRQLLHRQGVVEVPIQSGRCSTFDKEQVVTFAKSQRLRNAFLKAQVARERGNPDLALQIVQDCGKTFQRLYMNGSKPVTLLSTPPKETYRTGFISTGLPSLDKVMRGGVASGDLAVVMAPTNGGKTSFLIWIARTAVLAGKNVTFVSLEVPAQEVIGKMHRSLAESDPVNKKRWGGITVFLKKKKCDVTVQEYPPHTMTVDDLDARLPKETELLIVDPADSLLTRERAAAIEYFGIGSLYTGLKSIGMRRKIPVWSSSQVNRAGYDEETLYAQHVEGSLRKVMDSDQVLTLQQAETDKRPDKKTGISYGKIHVAKNRHGERFLELPLTIHFATCGFKEGNWT